MAKRLLNSCCSFSTSKVEKLVFIIFHKRFDVITFRKYAASVTDCKRITNGPRKWCLVEAEFEREVVNADKDVLYKKKPIEVLQKQLQIANVDKNEYF